jgi:hypothetical protein
MPWRAQKVIAVRRSTSSRYLTRWRPRRRPKRFERNREHALVDGEAAPRLLLGDRVVEGERVAHLEIRLAAGALGAVRHLLPRYFHWPDVTEMGPHLELESE